MIPLALIGLFALGVWMSHDAWTTPVQQGPAVPGRRRQPVQEFLHRAGLHDVTPRDFLTFSAAAGVAFGAVSQVILGWPLVSVVAGSLGAGLPYLVYASREASRRAHVQAELADAMILLRNSIRAGGDLYGGMQALATYAPPLLRPEFGRAVQLMTHGATLRDALLAMRDRLADPVFDTCVATLLLNENLGSTQLTPVLSELAEAVREELRVQADLHSRRTHVVWSARAIAALPLVALAAVRVESPHYLDVFNTTGGQIVLAGCVVSLLIGYVGMRWAGRLPVEQRVLVS